MKTNPTPQPWLRFPPGSSLATLLSLSLLGTQASHGDLVHRWSFNNAAGSADGATVPDAIGGASFDGLVLGNGATFTGTALRLPGGASGSAPYVDLPNDLIGANSPIATGNKNTLSIEGWITLKGTTGNWARYFDFGTNTVGEVLAPGGGFNGNNYLFYSAATGDNYNTQQLEIRVSADANQNTVYRPDRAAVLDQVVYFAITADSSNGIQTIFNLWRNGEHLITDQSSPFLLNQITDVNNWLGRSNWSGDANLNAEYDEFRLYDHVLSPEEIFASRASGPVTLVVDTDNDGMPDGYEQLNGLTVGVNDGGLDLDSDTLTNVQEFQRGTNPQSADTDSDNLGDAKETNTGVWVSPNDTGTDPLNPDTDRDGLKDNVESNTGTFSSTTNTGTNPHLRDSDSDLAGDATEVASSSDPNIETSVPAPKLVHRYSFSETTGTRVTDSVSGAHGHVHGAGFTRAAGILSLAGGSSASASYVSLPVGILSNHGAAKGGRGAVTIEGWATVNSTNGGVWARLVDFGTSDPAASGAITGLGNWNGGGTAAVDTFFLSAYNGTDTANRTLSLRKADGLTAPTAEFNVSQAGLGTPVHFVITFDESSGQLRYYENGNLGSFTETNAGNPIKLGILKDINNWLGRSNFTVDGNVDGSYDELRIYDGALSLDVITAHNVAGPDATPGPAADATDTDSDGIPNWYERAHGLNPTSAADAAADPDIDTVTNLQEFQRGALPNSADSDGDGLSDAAETNTGTFLSATSTGTDPYAYDSDGDFASDHLEAALATNPNDPAQFPATLLHRWSFNNAAGAADDGATTPDSVTGLSNAVVRGAGGTFTGSAIALPGGSSASAAYVDLPNGMISPLKALTVETWVSLQSNTNAWARLFDFGNTLASPGVPKEITGPGDGGEGGDYFFVSAAVDGTNYEVNRMEIRDAAPGPAVGTLYNPGVTYVQDQVLHYVAMVESATTGTSRLTLWRNGVPLLLNVPANVNLSSIDDVNNWIGRSNWTGDANVAGTFDEFRIYHGLLAPEQVAENFAAGPDAVIGPVDSSFQISAVSAPTGQPVSITFPTEIGKTYQVESSTSLTAPWSNVGNPVAGTGATVTVQDTVNGIPSIVGGRRFYHVRRN
ncbi:MAG: LamG-like jellyroll fold domain-containing protein [Verrucomicrobiota bacterium]